jgi:hypothetical protein
MIRRRIRELGLAVVLASTACAKGPEATDGTDPVQLAGPWRDAVGDAPWQRIDITPRDARHGHFAGSASCAAGPCPVSDQGDYDFDGKTLAVHSPKLEGQRYTVHVGGDVMEWRQNDVMIRRFKREPPAPPSAPREPPEDYPSKSAARPPGTPCDTLTAQGCLLSKECVLEHQPVGGYVCRPAVPPCEGGVAQAAPDFAADCKARNASSVAHGGPGCSLHPSRCYCPNASTKVAPPPDSAEARLASVVCVCGGGPYEQCVRGR